MGWTAGELDGPFTSKAAIAFELGEEFGARVLDTARYGTVIYAAVRSREGNEVFGLVLLAQRSRGILYTKPIPEEMGPAEDACPARILDLLTEPSNARARVWRRRCRARLERGRPRPRQDVVFDPPPVFSDGTLQPRLTFVGGARFLSPDGRLYHLRNWAQRRYRLEPLPARSPDPSTKRGECIVCGHLTADRSYSGRRWHWRCGEGEECAVRRNSGKSRPRPEALVRAEWRRRQQAIAATADGGGVS